MDPVAKSGTSISRKPLPGQIVTHECYARRIIPQAEPYTNERRNITSTPKHTIINFKVTFTVGCAHLCSQMIIVTLFRTYEPLSAILWIEARYMEDYINAVFETSGASPFSVKVKNASDSFEVHGSGSSVQYIRDSNRYPCSA